MQYLLYLHDWLWVRCESLSLVSQSLERISCSWCITSIFSVNVPWTFSPEFFLIRFQDLKHTLSYSLRCPFCPKLWTLVVFPSHQLLRKKPRNSTKTWHDALLHLKASQMLASKKLSRMRLSRYFIFVKFHLSQRFQWSDSKGKRLTIILTRSSSLEPSLPCLQLPKYAW